MKEKQKKMSFWGLLKYILRRKILVIFSLDFKESDMKDGYLRRVAFCDGLMEDRKRLVLDLDHRYKKTIIRQKGNKVVVIFSKNRLVRMFWVNLTLLLNHEVYCESVWQVKNFLFRFPFLKIYVDVHGAVPEEEFLYRKFESVGFYTDMEEKVVKKAKCLFCVTKAMEDHLRKKYGEDMRAEVVILPIIDEIREIDEEKVLKSKNKKGTLAMYAGGIFKWQNIELMCEIIKKNTEVDYEIYTPDVSGFLKIFGKEGRDKIKIGTVTPEVLRKEIYPRADYGFVLRDDIVVNNVACPTKISEYIENGLIPIVKSEKIGDFVGLGMKYITEKEFVAGKLYSYEKRQEIIKNNFQCLYKYYEMGKVGVEKFKEVMC